MITFDLTAKRYKFSSDYFHTCLHSWLAGQIEILSRIDCSDITVHGSPPTHPHRLRPYEHAVLQHILSAVRNIVCTNSRTV